MAKKSIELIKMEKRAKEDEMIRKMKKYVAELSPKMKKMWDTATEMRSKGFAAPCRNAITSWNAMRNQQRRTEEMIMSYEMIRQMNDFSEMEGQFLTGIDTLTAEMSKFTVDPKKFRNTATNIKAGIINSSAQTKVYDDLMQGISSAFETGEDLSGDPVDMQEIYDLMDGKIKSDEAVVRQNSVINKEIPLEPVIAPKAKVSAEGEAVGGGNGGGAMGASENTLSELDELMNRVNNLPKQ